MFTDQPQKKPFQSIFSHTPNPNPPTDGGGRSFEYPRTGRGETDNAIGRNDLSPYTDEQPVQAASVYAGPGSDEADLGERGNPRANRLEGVMLDDTAKPAIAAPKTVRTAPPKKAAAPRKPTKKAKTARKPAAKAKAGKKTAKKAVKQIAKTKRAAAPSKKKAAKKAKQAKKLKKTNGRLAARRSGKAKKRTTKDRRKRAMAGKKTGTNRGRTKTSRKGASKKVKSSTKKRRGR